MTETSKAPTNTEIVATHDAMRALRARQANARSFIDRATRHGKSLRQAKRYDVVGIALTLGYCPRRCDSKAAILAIIEAELAK